VSSGFTDIASAPRTHDQLYLVLPVRGIQTASERGKFTVQMYTPLWGCSYDLLLGTLYHKAAGWERKITF
jgi:hypothetical protein